MFFFDLFPTIEYDVPLTNITKRFSFLREILLNDDNYVSYALADWDTPEKLALKFYGSEEQSWLILLANRTENPFSCFYRSNYDLIKFCNMKYDIAIYSVHHLIDTDNNPVDEIDTWYYNNKPLALRDKLVYPVTNYDYEYNRNEDAKVIKLLQPYLVPQIENEIRAALTPSNIG
jgi:hypothetical protein